MMRLTSIALLCLGAALLVTWMAAPASSEPQVAGPVGPPIDRATASASIEVEPVRLPRLGDPSEAFEIPSRDPFSYERPAALDAGAESGLTGEAWTTTPVPTAPRLPELVAIVADETPGADGASHRAAIRSDTGQIRIVAAGASVDGIVVVAVESDAVVFRDEATDTTRRVPLR